MECTFLSGYHLVKDMDRIIQFDAFCEKLDT